MSVEVSILPPRPMPAPVLLVEQPDRSFVLAMDHDRLPKPPPRPAAVLDGPQEVNVALARQRQEGGARQASRAGACCAKPGALTPRRGALPRWTRCNAATLSG